MDGTRFADIEPEELADTLGELRALMTAVHAELIDVIAAFDESQCYRLDGMPDTATWLAARSNLSLPTARREVDIATRAPAIPALMQAWREGRLSWDQLLVLAPVATAETDTDGDLDAELAEKAPGWSYHSTVVKGRALRPVSPKDALAQHQERFVQLTRRRDSTVRIRGQLSGEQAVIVEETLNRLADKLPEEGRLEQGEPVRRGARMADALVTMCEAHPEILAQNPARPLVVIHIGAERLADDPAPASSGATPSGPDVDRAADGPDAQPGDPGTPGPPPDPPDPPDPAASVGPGGPGGRGPVTIGNGWAIAGETARRLACDCRWQIVAHDTTGHTIGVSRESRRIPSWLARVVTQRDQHRCRWPKCDRTVWLEHHHITHWANGGPTDENNLLTMCWHHHHMLHEGQWNMTIDETTRETTLIKPDGQPYEPPSEPMSLSEPTRKWLAQLMSPPPHSEAA